MPSFLRANTVLAHPIVGISTSTPKWEAIPNPLGCKIPFPSTSITWGIYFGFLFFKSFINSTYGFTSLKAKNDGIYGSSIFISL